MTKEQAEYIRELRVDRGCSWRRLHELYCERYDKESMWPGNQIKGRDLCVEASEVLGVGIE